MVVDFDRTLIKCDSVKLLIKKMKKPKLYYYGLLRKLRLLTKSKFAEKVTNFFFSYTENNGIDKINEILLPMINDKVLSHINNFKKTNSEIIILSASPNCYIKSISSKMGFKGFGSNIMDNSFHYMYHKNKIKFILVNYPASEYVYQYAISDHKSDIELLCKFNRKFLVKHLNSIIELYD